MSVVDIALMTAESSVRAALMLIAVLVLCRLLAERTSVAARRAYLLAALVSVPALPALGTFVPGLPLSLPEALDARAIADRAAAVSSSTSVAPIDVLGLAWLSGAAMMLARLAVGTASVHRQSRSASTLLHPDWLADRDRMADVLGLRRLPDLRLSGCECMPYAWGYLHPIVVLPASAMTWPSARRRAVLAHELGHLARHEPVARFAVELVRALHWFDPLLRQVARRFRQESEVAADQAALTLGLDARQYAAELLGLARARTPGAAARIAPSLAGPGSLEHRVERLLAAENDLAGDRRNAASRRSLRLSSAAVPALAISLAVLAAMPRLAPSEAPLAQWSQRFGIAPELAGEIVAAAHQEGIDARVAFGLVAEESAFDPDRISANGAVGLTQMLPATARTVAPGLSLDKLRGNPDNLRIGFRYLRTQIEREGGNVVRGLAAYALGPRRLDDIRGRGEPIPLDYPARVLARFD